jgi:hypothetical protein
VGAGGELAQRQGHRSSRIRHFDAWFASGFGREVEESMGKMMLMSVGARGAGEVAFHGVGWWRVASSPGKTEPGRPALGSQRGGARDGKEVMKSLLVRSRR